MTSPAPDTSADWGYSDHSVLDTGGLDIGKATAPADPMSFLPNSADPIYGNSPDPVPNAAPWGYEDHGVTDT